MYGSPSRTNAAVTLALLATFGIAMALLERETLGREQLELLLANRALPPAPAPVESKRSRKPESEADGTEPERPLGGKGIPDPEPIPG